MKSIAISTLFFIIFGYSMFSQCPDGNITFNSQEEIDNFITSYPDCTEISGGLSIIGVDITDLSGLSGIISLEGRLFIYNNTNLTNLNGLNNLVSVGAYVKIASNDALVDISALNGVTSIGTYLEISSNNSLPEITGFNNLTSINDDLAIQYNQSLETIVGFNNLTSIFDDLSIKNNQSLETIDGFNNLTNIEGGLKIYANSNLTNLNGLNNLVSVGAYVKIASNTALVDISALNGLISIGTYLKILSNNSLPEISGFNSVTSNIQSIEISDNNALILVSGFNNIPLVTDFVIIEENDLLSDLSILNSLTSINGNFSILNNQNLETMNSFNSVQNIGGAFNIRSNDALININGFNSLTSIASHFSITFNGSLISLSGLENLEVIGGYLIVSSNVSLQNIDALNNVITIGGSLHIGSSYSTDIGNPALESVSFSNLVSIGGDLEITKNPEITELSDFNMLESIHGYVSFNANHNLVTISGFNNVNYIQSGFEIHYNLMLQSILGFNGIVNFDGSYINILNNESLNEISGFQILNHIAGRLVIDNNASLTTLEGFSNLTSIGTDLRIGAVSSSSYNSIGNPVLVSLHGFESLITVGGDVEIGSNESLVNLTGLSSLTTIGEILSIDGIKSTGNASLINLEGMDMLEAVGEDIIIKSNESLLELGMPNLTTVNGLFEISNNTQLENLHGLESLNAVYQGLSINQNTSLSNIDAISNIDHNSLGSLTIQNNTMLSECNVSSICNYLNLPESDGLISWNAIGCDSESSILESCENTSYITGTVKLDMDNNGCDNNSDLILNIPVTTTNGSTNFSTFTNNNGIFKIFVPLGTFTTELNYNTNLFSVDPEYSISEFNIIDNETVDFCLTPEVSENNLSVVIVPLIDARPGFDVNYLVIYKNDGSTSLSGSVNLWYDNTMALFNEAIPEISTQNNNQINWEFSDLHPFESRSINIDFSVFEPTMVESGDVLNLTASIDPVSNDYMPQDNTFELQQIVVNSFDPNDIICLEGEQILLENADEYLHYLIRFQNIGTASAVNIVVSNLLDNKLDATTLQLESVSHNNRVAITNGNEIEFIFESINLPDSTTDEVNSHGYIAYRIKPVNTVDIGDIIPNQADIFFDYNGAIETNVYNTEIVETIGIDEYNRIIFSVSPSPTNGIFELQSNEKIIDIEIYNQVGQLIKTSNVNSIDISDFSQGVYYIKVLSENGKSGLRKVIKK